MSDTTAPDRPELDHELLADAQPVMASDGVTPLTEEEVAERYQDPPVYKDPNTPISKVDPNDRLRAEGPEVADPAKVAAAIIFEEAKANMPEPTGDQTADDLARFDTVAATGTGSGAADTSK